MLFLHSPALSLLSTCVTAEAAREETQPCVPLLPQAVLDAAPASRLTAQKGRVDTRRGCGSAGRAGGSCKSKEGRKGWKPVALLDLVLTKQQ